MSPFGAPALAIWALAAQAVVSPPPSHAELRGGAPAPLRVLEHVLRPGRPEAGARADERVVVWTPEGISLGLSDAAPPEALVERLGSWWVTRAPDAGGVRWTFTAPVVAWAQGSRRGPELTLSQGRVEGGPRTSVHLPGIAFEVATTLDGEGSAVEPAPPEGPLPSSPWSWPATLAAGLVPALAAVGLLRRRASVSVPSPSPRESGPVAPRAAPGALAEALAGAPRDPASAAVALADAVRAHPQVAGCGVTLAHTTGEVARRAPLEGVEEVLALADAVKFGGYTPAPEEVVGAGHRVARALEGAVTPHG